MSNTKSERLQAAINALPPLEQIALGSLTSTITRAIRENGDTGLLALVLTASRVADDLRTRRTAGEKLSEVADAALISTAQ